MVIVPFTKISLNILTLCTATLKVVILKLYGCRIKLEILTDSYKIKNIKIL